MKPEETLDFHIKSSWHTISRMYNQLASQYGMSQAIGYALLNINEESGTPATRIGPLMGMEPTSLTRLLKNMEERGLICRKKDHSDGRLVNIHLTKFGLEKRKLTRNVVREFNRRVLEKISKDEFLNFVDVMERVQEVAVEYKEETI